MSTAFLRSSFVLAISSAVALSPFVAPVIAQDVNPFEEFADEPLATEEEAAVEATSDAEPDAAPAAPQPAPPAGAPTLADYARREPTVAVVLDLPRDTPAQKFRAVIMLIDLGHPGAAALILPELLQTQLDDAQRAALVHEFGVARFLKLIRLDAPGAEGAPAGPLAGLRAFAQACLDAASAHARDPQRIAALVAQLQSPDAEQRYAARVDLRATGDAGIIAAFSGLAAAPNKNARANIMVALAEMRPAVDEPLLAVLADARGQLRRDAAELAGHLKLDAATPLLAAIAVSDDSVAASAANSALAKLGRPAPTPAELQTLLRQKLAAVKSDPISSSADGLAGVWWSWNHETQRLTAAEFPVPQLRTLAAARLSRALISAGGLALPDDQRLALIYGLEESALLSRPLSQPLQQSLAAMRPADLSAALATATEEEFIAAAIQITAELARRGDVSILVTSDGRPSPLAAALVSPERALRFAALSAIMQLAPTRSFPGSSHVADSLWFFVAGAGEPTAIAASPDIVQASNWAGELRGAGYDAMPTRTGREALMAAIDPATSARLAMIVLDSDIGQPLIGEVVYQLHTSDRTAGVPILIASSVPRLAAAQRIAANDPLVRSAPRPHGAGALASLVERTIALTGRSLAPKDVRTSQAAQALAWLAKLLTEGSPYDELQRDAALGHRALLIPELSGHALAVLAALGTADSQTALLDYASSLTLPIDARRGAASAFATSVQQHGLHIAGDDILRQYDRYNASETADADTQQVLGQILDVIERKPVDERSRGSGFRSQ